MTLSPQLKLMCRSQWFTAWILLMLGVFVLAFSLQRSQARASGVQPSASPQSQTQSPYQRGWSEWFDTKLPGSVPYIFDRVGDRTALLVASEGEESQLRLSYVHQRSEAARHAMKVGEGETAYTTLSKGHIYLAQAAQECYQNNAQQVTGCGIAPEVWRARAHELNEALVFVLSTTTDDGLRARLTSLQSHIFALQTQFGW